MKLLCNLIVTINNIDWPADSISQTLADVCHEKTDLKAFVVVIPKEGWPPVAAPFLLLV